MQDRELVPAQACDHIVFPHAGFDAPGHFLQQQITHRMAEGVVDPLEVIQVQIKYRECLCASTCGSKGLMQAFDQGGAIGQAGEPVGAGEQGHFFFGQPAFGNVENDPLDFQQATVMVAYGNVAVLHPAPCTLAGAQAKLNRGAQRMAVQHPGHGRIDTGLVFRVDQLLGPVGRTHQIGGDVSVAGDVMGNVHQRKRRFATQPVKDRRAVLHDDIGVGQFPGTLLDRLFQQVHLERGIFGHLPFDRECAGHLAYLDGVEGLFQNQQAVVQRQPLVDVLPGIVGVGGAQRHLQFGIDLP
ncbi:hypothetical protein D3C71_1383980 [compost metagenome]